MAAVTICSDFGAQENKICNCFHFFPSIWHEVMGLDAKILVFWMVSFKPAFHSPLPHSSRSSLVPLYFLPLKGYYLQIWGCWYFSWQSWFQLVIHPASYFIWYILHILNKQGDNIQPFCTSLPILAQSVVPCLILTVVSWPTYRFLRRQIRWSGISISLRIFHSLLSSTQSKALV